MLNTGAQEAAPCSININSTRSFTMVRSLQSPSAGRSRCTSAGVPQAGHLCALRPHSLALRRGCACRHSHARSSAPSARCESGQQQGGQDSEDPQQALNKVPTTLSPQLYRFLLEHTREHAALAALRQETAELHGSHMQITPEQGTLLALLAELVGTKRAIEVGVFTGYSALSVALVLPEDGMLVACDKDAKSMRVAAKFFELAGVSHKVLPVVGPALDSLRQLLAKYGPNSFDFAFLDADKRQYDAYYELLLQLVRPGGLICVDNVLFYGKVADPEVNDKATVALRQLAEKLLSDPRISLSIVPVGDGLALCRKRG